VPCRVESMSVHLFCSALRLQYPLYAAVADMSALRGSGKVLFYNQIIMWFDTSRDDFLMERAAQ